MAGEIETDLNTRIFTYSDMQRTWEEAQLSFVKETGGDVSDEDYESSIFNNFKEYMLAIFNVKLTTNATTSKHS